MNNFNKEKGITNEIISTFVATKVLLLNYFFLRFIKRMKIFIRSRACTDYDCKEIHYTTLGDQVLFSGGYKKLPSFNDTTLNKKVQKVLAS